MTKILTFIRQHLNLAVIASALLTIYGVALLTQGFVGITFI